MDSTTTMAPSLGDTLAMLRRRWIAILAPALIVVGAAMAYAQYAESNLEPTYEVTSRLSVNPLRGLAVSLEQFAIVVNEGEVGQDAKASLPRGVEARVTATAQPDLGLIDIAAVADDPEQARTAVAAYRDALISFTTSADEDQYDEQHAALEAEVDRTAADLEIADFEVFSNPGDRGLETQRDLALAQAAAAEDNLQAFEAQGAPEPQFLVLTEGAAVEVPPAGFVGMPLPRQLAIALAVGLVVGLAVAFLLEAIDRRLEGPASTSHAFGVPVLAEVPDAGRAFAKGTDIAPPASMLMEAYRRLRTIIQLERDASDARADGAVVILVTSGSPAEGKTVTASHLAVALAEAHDRVLLVSADFRRPALHKYFGVEPTGGLDTLASSTADTDELVKPTKYPGVSIITAGRGTHEPADLLLHAKRVVSEARKLCDYVVIDTSPLLSANDALDLVKQSDVVLVVSRFRKTTTPAAHRVRDMLLQIGAPVLGVVSTGVTEGEGYYYYGGDYGPDKDALDTDPVTQT